MYDLHETVAIDYKLPNSSGGHLPKHDLEVQVEDAHPLANVPEGKLGECLFQRA